MPLLRSIGATLEMIKWEHSVFALPFALTGAMLAAHGWPSAAKLLWIVVCMIDGALGCDGLQSLGRCRPRCRQSAHPRARHSRRACSRAALPPASPSLCRRCFSSRLRGSTGSPSSCSRRAAVCFFYSYTKRFTRWSHLFLGLALGIAPSAAWIAIRGSLDPRILVLTAAVLFWVAGFDVLYACQDEVHDRACGCSACPAAIGTAPAFLIARIMHLLMLALLVWLVFLFHLGPIAGVGIAAVAALLFWEHLLVSPRDLSRLNAAFFTMNGVISVIFFAFVAADLLLHRRG